MCFRATLLLVALATLVHTDKLPVKKKCGLAYVSAEPNSSKEHPPVMMLHAISYSKKTWNGIYQKIPFLTGRQVFAFDFRDHGESFWSDNITVPYLMDDLKCFMDDQKIEKAAIVGHSMGGAVAMQFALKYPCKVERIFVEDIGPNISTEVIASIKKEMDLLVDSEKDVPENADEATAKKAMADYIRQVAPGTDPQGVFEQKMPVIFRHGAWHWQTNFNAMVKAWGPLSASFGKYQGRYCGKSHFIYSTASPLQVGEQKKTIKKLFPKAKFVPVKGPDHFIHIKHRKKYLTALIKLLNCKPVCTDSDVNND